MSDILQVILPRSGQPADIRRPTGHDMVKAELLVENPEGKAIAMQMALLSRITTIDGKTLPLEDFLDLDMEDLIFLGKLELPGSGASQPPSF